MAPPKSTKSSNLPSGPQPKKNTKKKTPLTPQEKARREEQGRAIAECWEDHNRCYTKAYNETCDAIDLAEFFRSAKGDAYIAALKDYKAYLADPRTEQHCRRVSADVIRMDGTDLDMSSVVLYEIDYHETLWRAKELLKEVTRGARVNYTKNRPCPRSLLGLWPYGR